MTTAFLNVCNSTYTMIVSNPLLLAFVIMCAIFIGCALLKKLFDL